MFQKMTITQLITQNYFILQILPGNFSSDEKVVARQAFAGLLWNKQIYKYNGCYWREDFESRLKRKYLSDTDDCPMEDVKRVMESNMMKDDVKFIEKHCRIQHLRQEWRNETKGETKDLKLEQ